MIYDLDGMLPQRAFQRDARGQIKPQGGGGGTPTNQTVTSTSIPEYLRPYVEKAMGQAGALTDISQNPYQPYGGQKNAAFTPLQVQAMKSVSGMQVAPQLGDASNYAYTAGQQGLGAGAQYANMATSPGSINKYMSPYMQNAVDVQKQEAIRDYEKTMPTLGSQAARVGAFGGSRQAIAGAEAQRNVNQQLANIQATGSQQAYDKAMQSMQFGSNLGLQGAGLANQSAGILGQLGQTQFGQQSAITDAQMRAGQLQQAQEQKGLDFQYQQYLDSLNYPYKQLGFLSDMFRGLPLSQSTQSMYQNPSVLSQGIGLGTAGYGLYQMGKAEGGQIEESDGLDALGMYNAMKGDR
jgi:hypothetical protein